MLNQKANTLFLGLDFDGCTDTPEARTNLIRNVISTLTSSDVYDRIYVGIMSLRQDVANDYHNCKRLEDAHEGQLVSCSILGQEFMDKLRQSIIIRKLFKKTPNIHFIPLLMVDVLNNLCPGYTLNHMDSKVYENIKSNRKKYKLKIRNRNQEEIILAEWDEDGEVYRPLEDGFSDEMKILTHYMFMHYLAAKVGPHQKIDFYFFDDRKDIIQHVRDFFDEHRFLMPHNCGYAAINFVNNQTHQLREVPKMVYGLGVINIDYDLTIRTVKSQYITGMAIEKALSAHVKKLFFMDSWVFLGQIKKEEKAEVLPTNECELLAIWIRNYYTTSDREALKKIKNLYNKCSTDLLMLHQTLRDGMYFENMAAFKSHMNEIELRRSFDNVMHYDDELQQSYGPTGFKYTEISSIFMPVETLKIKNEAKSNAPGCR